VNEVDVGAIYRSFKPVNHPSDIFLNLIDLDGLFAISPNAIIVNRIPSTDPDFVERRNRLLFGMRRHPDVDPFLQFVAHCDCWNLSGNLNVGRTCSDCRTVCRDDFSSDERLEHNSWLGIPPPLRVLHPIAYIVLSQWLSRKGVVNCIDAIIDSKLELPAELHGVVLGRGHEYFERNFDQLMAYFLDTARGDNKRVSAKRKNADYIEQFIKAYRPVLFCSHLPVMASVLHSITSADGGPKARQYADASLQIILDACTDLQQIEETMTRRRPDAMSTAVHRVYKTYISYIVDIAKTRLSTKKSLIRGHMLGTRLHFSIRSVIIPHPDEYDHLYFPWAITVNLLRLHIVGRLTRKHGLSIGEATARQVAALLQYDAGIDQIMKDLIAECNPEFPGIPILFNRNPSLKRGAIQLLYLTRVKTDLHDKTINISTKVLRAPNADFDGDALNGVMLLEMDAAQAFQVLHPSRRIRSTREPRISSELSLPKQSLAVLNSFLQDED
jgi:hypothetical protein